MKLLESFKLGDLTLQNRMAMAPMTRSRAKADGTVKEITATYYEQRSTAGLLITEAVNISEQAIGSPLTPGIYTQAQVDAWRIVTDRVHKAGGKIFMQLWHTGRVGHSIDKGGMQPVAPSAIAIEGQKHFTSQGPKDYEVPRALETGEVKAIVKDYAEAARKAKQAGFDGVELHGAFGYLPNQFLVDGANKRTDEYGGDIAGRSRFVLEVMAALVDVWGADKVGIKLSPSIPYNGMIDSDPTALFGYLITELNKLPLAYIQLMNALFPLDHFPHWPKDVLKTFKPMSKHIIMANGGYTRETGESTLQSGEADLISYGALFLANPDLVKRFAVNSSVFNSPDRATMYGGGEQGYIDYPLLDK
jgi:N-ethylmaleimide reductase